jgi:hypothetical protein
LHSISEGTKISFIFYITDVCIWVFISNNVQKRPFLFASYMRILMLFEWLADYAQVLATVDLRQKKQTSARDSWLYKQSKQTSARESWLSGKNKQNANKYF